MIFKGKLALLGVSALLATSCMNEEKTQGNKETANKAEIKVEPGIDLANLDQTAKPGVNFFQYANGGWLKKNPIPGDKSAYGAFNKISDDCKENLKVLINEVTNDKNASDGSINQKIRDFYNSGMDTVAIEKAGYEPLKPYLESVDNVKDVNSLLDLMSDLQLESTPTGFYVYVGQDAKKSDQHALCVTNAGLSLSDRDYYLNDDPRSIEIREKYVQHIVNMEKLIGIDEAQAQADAETVLKMETAMADKYFTRVQGRDPKLTYNKISYTNLKADYPNYGWDNYFGKLGVESDSVIISNPGYFKAFNNWLVEYPIQDWKTYVKWHILSDASGALSSPFVDESFDFYGRFMSGIDQQSPRWKKVLGSTNGALGEAIGQLYVKKHFPAEAKERMLELVSNLRLAFEDRIKGLEWMSEETKLKALHKLEVITVKVGYPDKWKDYSDYKVSKNYFKNLVASAKFQYRENMEDLKKPVDKDKWEMLPQTVNAYYHPLRNEVVFPAAILQPPFFNMNADDPVNYGGIGVVIGHEMTHGFDDKGRLFDADGNMKEWWTATDADKFTKRAQVLVDQFDNYVVLDSLHVNGKLTLGENIADQGGLNISYNAMMKAMEKTPMESIDGFTPEQRFFLGYASVWRINMKDKELMNRIKTDVHSPAAARVNQAIFNLDEFYKAFDIPQDAPLYIKKEDRAKIW
ncbi:MAG: M13 family metallopeptidase [Bacteroidales bacterium]